MKEKSMFGSRGTALGLDPASGRNRNGKGDTPIGCVRKQTPIKNQRWTKTTGEERKIKGMGGRAWCVSEKPSGYRKRRSKNPSQPRRKKKKIKRRNKENEKCSKEPEKEGPSREGERMWEHVNKELLAEGKKGKLREPVWKRVKITTLRGEKKNTKNRFWNTTTSTLRRGKSTARRSSTFGTMKSVMGRSKETQ